MFNENDEFLKKSIKNDKVRKAIIHDYHEILEYEKDNQKYANKSMALKLNKDQKLILKTREPNVEFKSNQEKKKEKRSKSKNKKNKSSKKAKDEIVDNSENSENDSEKDIYDLNSNDGGDSKTTGKVNGVETPGLENEDKEERVITKVKDLLELGN